MADWMECDRKDGGNDDERGGQASIKKRGSEPTDSPDNSEDSERHEDRKMQRYSSDRWVDNVEKYPSEQNQDTGCKARRRKGNTHNS